jgi:acyl carrier protein
MKITYEQFFELIKSNATGFNRTVISADDQLADMGIDSLGFATLLFALEDQFNAQIDERYLEKLNSLTRVRDLVEVFKGLGYEIELREQIPA